jgi:hypothetical protein
MQNKNAGAPRTESESTLETRLHPGCNSGDGGGHPRHFMGAPGHIDGDRMTCIFVVSCDPDGIRHHGKNPEAFVTSDAGRRDGNATTNEGARCRVVRSPDAAA